MSIVIITIMRKVTLVEITKADIPVETAAAVDVAEAVDHSLRLQGATWAKHAALITEEHLMTEHSLIPLMTVENHWNLSVAQAR